MLIRILRYYHTLKYLKSVQIFYQLLYRFKNYFPYFDCRPKQLDVTSIPLRFASYRLINSQNKIIGNYRFNFLNISHKFKDEIDWHFSKYGKLWYYNLQYFDYLFDATCDNAYKNLLIDDASERILNGHLKLEPYPVSLRIINWILYHSQTGFLSISMGAALAVQIKYLRENIEYHIQANHLIENFTSLIVSSYFLKDVKLFSFSSENLIRQLKIQILPDGAHYEGSPMYHQIVLSKMLLIFDLEKKQPLASPEFLKILQKYIMSMFGWITKIYFNNGDMPLLNDAANGIAPTLTTLDQVRTFLEIPMQKASNLLESGFIKLSNASIELLVSAGNIVPTYQPSHRHSDMLSFCLYVNQKSLIIDPGISTYNNNAIRQFERSTQSHNTVTINQENQSDIWSIFRIGKRAKIFVNQAKENYLSAYHDGYLKKFKVNHQREFKLTPYQVEISDKLVTASGDLTLLKGECRFYFNHRVRVENRNNSIIADDVIITFEGDYQLILGRYDQPQGYNIYLPSTFIKVEFMGLLVTKVRIA